MSMPIHVQSFRRDYIVPVSIAIIRPVCLTIPTPTPSICPLSASDPQSPSYWTIANKSLYLISWGAPSIARIIIVMSTTITACWATEDYTKTAKIILCNDVILTTSHTTTAQSLSSESWRRPCPKSLECPSVMSHILSLELKAIRLKSLIARPHPEEASLSRHDIIYRPSSSSPSPSQNGHQQHHCCCTSRLLLLLKNTNQLPIETDMYWQDRDALQICHNVSISSLQSLARSDLVVRGINCKEEKKKQNYYQSSF